MTALNFADYARHRHTKFPDEVPVEQKTLSAAGKSGRLPLFKSGANKGKVNVARADAEWAPSANGAKRGVPRVVPRTQAGSEPPAETPREPKNQGVETVSQARQVIEKIKAKRELAAWNREQGESIEKRDHVAALVDMATRVRGKMQSLPRKMQAEMVRHLRCKTCGGDVDGKAIAIAAERYINDVLLELAADPFG